LPESSATPSQHRPDNLSILPFVTSQFAQNQLVFSPGESHFFGIMGEMMDPLQILALAAETVQQSDLYNKSATDLTIRRARYADIPYLGPIERSAAQLFRTANLNFFFDGPTVDPNFLAQMTDQNHLWVAVDRMGEPIGFVGGENVAGNFHVVEISVAQTYQGRGVGKALMGQMMEEIRREGYKTITLTTYRDLPWNGRWYARMGFSEVQVVEMGPEFWEIWQTEAHHGHDMRTRCLMRKIL
jgi:ribosomal protein S18 acetylase RimI-like enzyme